MQTPRLLVCVALLVAAGCEAVPPGSGSPAADEPIADAGPDAAPAPVTCCRLSNERGERLDFKCSSSPAFDVGYLEGRGYRCVSTPR